MIQEICLGLSGLMVSIIPEGARPATDQVGDEITRKDLWVIRNFLMSEPVYWNDHKAAEFEDYCFGLWAENQVSYNKPKRNLLPHS